jgi:hypothetical protein
VTLERSVLIEMLGWAATATFVGSYLARRAETLVRVQIAGALMWAVYGVLLRSAPVIAANVLVVAAASWKARTSTAAPPMPSPGTRCEEARRESEIEPHARKDAGLVHAGDLEAVSSVVREGALLQLERGEDVA